MKKIKKIKRKIKSLKNKHQADNQVNNSEYLKSWTNKLPRSKLKSAGNFQSSFDDKSGEFFENLITIEELADYIGVSQKTIRNWVAMRSIPFLRIGRKTFFYFDKLDKWFQTKEFEPCL